MMGRTIAVTVLAIVLGLACEQRVVAEETYPSAESLPTISGLPDPLVMFHGAPVQSREDWFQRRRPELKRLFARYMYGEAPAPTKVVPQIDRIVRKTIFDGKGRLEQIPLVIEGPHGRPAAEISLLLILPVRSGETVPVFAGLNFWGNHAVLPDEEIAVHTKWVYPKAGGSENNRATAAGRGAQKDVWCAEYLVERGYGLATVYNGEIDTDEPNVDDGIQAAFRPAGTPPRPQDWGTIAAWAWGLSRVADYLQTRPDIDSQRIAAIGHSRLGKTALLAGAMDERFTLVVPHQSGTGGCALSRDNDQETVERINRVFPHWFNDEFAKFGDKPGQLPIEKLPVDQHLLIAMVAPRLLLDTEGDKDTWANYSSGFRAIREADRVFKFVGAEGLTGQEPIRGNVALTKENCGTLVQIRLDQEHVLNRAYWSRILDFADLRWK